MKLKDYISGLNKLVEEHPEAAEMEAIYSRDDEGNGYQKIHFSPAVVMAEDLEEYRIENVHPDKEEYEEEYDDEFSPNAVVVN